MRQQLARAIQGGGMLILGYCGVVYGRAALARDHARAEWEAAETHRLSVAVDRSVARNASLSTTPLVAGAPLGRLMIPKLDLDEIVVEGVGEAQLDAGPGHLMGSAWPGDPGNAIISAHRDRHFHGLDQLAPGDTIITETPARRVRWVVNGRRVVDRAAPALFATTKPTLTLTTCWPVTWMGPAPDRLIVTASPILAPAPGA